MASTNAGEFKNLCVEMQKTPVNRGVLSLLKTSKQVQNNSRVTFLRQRATTAPDISGPALPPKTGALPKFCIHSRPI
jgi:hypothetical protein